MTTATLREDFLLKIKGDPICIAKIAVAHDSATRTVEKWLEAGKENHKRLTDMTTLKVVKEHYGLDCSVEELVIYPAAVA